MGLDHLAGRVATVAGGGAHSAAVTERGISGRSERAGRKSALKHLFASVCVSRRMRVCGYRCVSVFV